MRGRVPRPFGVITTPTDLQTQMDTFANYYNHCRPHRAQARRTPALAGRKTQGRADPTST